MSELNEYVVVKLTTGEQLLAMMSDEDEHYVYVLYPMTIRSLPVVKDDRTHERIVCMPFCQFTEDKMFQLPKSSIMFVKRLNETFALHYTKLVDEYESEEPTMRDTEQEDEFKFRIEGNDTLN